MKFSQVIVSFIAAAGLANAANDTTKSSTGAAVNMQNNIKNVGIAAGVAAAIGYLM